MSEPSAPAAADWAGVALLMLAGALAGLLETLLVPLYAGSVVLPVSVVLAIASNVLLPRLARALVPRTAVAIAPFLTWLVVVILFGVLARPEGDVVLPGSPASVQYVTYGVVFGGALAGTATLVMMTPPPPSRNARGGSR
jgi:predicted PurR-regulated permease PerM